MLPDIVASTESIETITIDDIFRDHIRFEPTLMVVKIDVEGSEVDALSGATETLRRNTLLIYEDHGRETDSNVSAHILNHLGLDVFHCDRNGRVRRMLDVAAVNEVKTRASAGYNFCAAVAGTPAHSELIRLHERG